MTSVKTEKLYDTDSYISSFSAKVLSCEKKDNNYLAVLDRTAFFPCGGGQYGDCGQINNVKVTDTQIENGVIFHTVSSYFSVGTEVFCTVDWQTRFNRMQNHTGEHIISGIIYKNYGYDNVGFHLSDDEMTIDTNGKLTDRDVKFIEDEGNRIIDENHAVRIYYPDSDELKNLKYRSKLELDSNVRIVEIDGVDTCACCAPHVCETAQVGQIKIIRFYNYKGGTRLHVRAGRSAREDYSVISNMTSDIVNNASAKRYELFEVYNRQNAEISKLKEELKKAKNALFDQALSAAKNQDKCRIYFIDSLSMADLISLCDASIKKYGDIAAAFSGDDTDGYKFALGGKNAGNIFEIMKNRLSVKGGGKDIFQGVASETREKIESILKSKI